MARRYADHVAESRPHLKRFARLLDETTVISDDFKAELYSWASAAVTEAFEAGEKRQAERSVGLYGGGDK